MFLVEWFNLPFFKIDQVSVGVVFSSKKMQSLAIELQDTTILKLQIWFLLDKIDSEFLNPGFPQGQSIK